MPQRLDGAVRGVGGDRKAIGEEVGIHGQGMVSRDREGRGETFEQARGVM